MRSRFGTFGVERSFLEGFDVVGHNDDFFARPDYTTESSDSVSAERNHVTEESVLVTMNALVDWYAPVTVAEAGMECFAHVGNSSRVRAEVK